MLLLLLLLFLHLKVNKIKYLYKMSILKKKSEAVNGLICHRDWESQSQSKVRKIAYLKCLEMFNGF